MLENGESTTEIGPAISLLKDTGVWQPVPGKRSIAYALNSGEHSIAPLDHSHTFITIKRDAQVLLHESFSGAQVGVYLIIEEGAKITYVSSTIAENACVQRFVHLGRDAQLQWTDISFGNVKSEHTAYLSQQGAGAQYRSVFLGSGQDRYGADARMIHAAGHTRSEMRSRAVLMEGSRGSYRGLIRIMPQAKGCEAYQRADTLLLGDDARMDAVPVLEISNNEVKCSHGVALGQVDEEQLFYLASRGISRSDAVLMIVQGFFEQALKDSGAGDVIMREMLARLEAI